jgi:hypothetical protein
VATRDVFSAGELARLRGFPEITRAELIRYFTLTGPDVAFLRKFHSRVSVLGAGVHYPGPGSWSCSTISSVQPDERLERVRLLREHGDDRDTCETGHGLILMCSAAGADQVSPRGAMGLGKRAGL